VSVQGNEEDVSSVAAHVRHSLRRAGVWVDGRTATHGAVDVRCFERTPGEGVLVTLAVDDPRGETIARFSLEHARSRGSRRDARLALEEDPAWRWLGVFVAAALGVPDARGPALAFCAHPSVGRAMRDILARHGFTPATPRERAYVLVAGTLFRECVALGADAVEPIERYLELCTSSALFIEAVNALASIGGPGVSRALLRALAWSPPSRSGEPFVNRPWLQAVLDAIARAGDESVLPELRRLATSGVGDVAEGARRAEGRLLERLRPFHSNGR
jgi:hypothetical protein